jgi:hypothetical protein
MSPASWVHRWPRATACQGGCGPVREWARAGWPDARCSPRPCLAADSSTRPKQAVVLLTHSPRRRTVDVSSNTEGGHVSWRRETKALLALAGHHDRGVGHRRHARDMAAAGLRGGPARERAGVLVRLQCPGRHDRLDRGRAARRWHRAAATGCAVVPLPADHRTLYRLPDSGDPRRCDLPRLWTIARRCPRSTTGVGREPAALKGATGGRMPRVPELGDPAETGTARRGEAGHFGPSGPCA